MNETRHPWDRREGEPPLWYNRFDSHFLPQGPERTLEEAWRRWKQTDAPGSKGKRPSAQWYARAKEFDWYARAQAWDDENRRKRIAEEEAARADMLRRHARQAQALQGVGALRLSLFDRDRLQELRRNDPKKYVEELEKISVGQARLLMQSGIGLERQALGLPDHLLAVAAMTDDELLEQYAGLLRTIAGTGGDPGGDGEAGDGDEFADVGLDGVLGLKVGG